MSDWPLRILAAYGILVTVLLFATVIWIALGWPH